MTVFDAASLHTAVVQALADAAIPAKDTHAFALVATSDGRVKAVVSMRVGDTWEIDSVVTIAKGHRVEGGIQVKTSW